MNALAAGLLGGILLSLATPMGWQHAALGSVVALSLLAGIGGRWALGIAAVAGFLLAQHTAQRVLSAAHDCGERRLVVARIQSIPETQGAGWQYEAIVEPVHAPRHAPLRVRVSQPSAAMPRSGERWQLLLQFDLPAAGAAADGLRRALLRDRVSATARVRDSPLNQRLSPAPPGIEALRLAVADRIRSRVRDPSAAALLAALAVGVTGDVSSLQWRVFSATGITHLVAISGMHVTFFALLCMSVARALWRRWGWLCGVCRRESFAAVVGVILAFAYALLSGFSVPAQRTALMLAAFLAARGCCRQVGSLWSVSAALVAVLAFDPMAALSAGFWLSFGAVMAIIVVAGGRLQAPGSLRAAAHVQWVVTVALLPVTAALFGSFSAVGPLVNAVAIPLFTLALVPPVLVATALYLVPLDLLHACANLLVDIAAWVAQHAWIGLVRAADLPAAAWNIDAGILWLLLAVPAVLGVLAPWPLPMRLGALGLLCSGFPQRVARPAPGALDLVVFNVGASRAVLLRTAGHQLLLGTGESFGTQGRRFERAVLPELLGSHGGVDLLLERADRDSLHALTLARARLPLNPVMVAMRNPAPELQPCVDGQWQWDNVRFLRRATSDGCWVGARIAGRLVLVAPARMPSGAMPDFGPADVLVLPRRAQDAGRVAARAAPDALLLASLTQSEWTSAGWTLLQAQRRTAGQSLWLTTRQGDLRLTLNPDGRLARHLNSAWRAGVWSGTADAAVCGAP